MKSKQELEDSFHWWVTCIPDNIEKLNYLIPKSVNLKLDYSIDSLDIIGRYLVEAETLESIQKKKDLWDSLASYIGVVYEKKLPTAKWRVELEDEKNIYYGIPALRTEVMTNFIPHYEITTMLDRKRPDFLSAITKKHMGLQISD
jgi:hypothetical protein